ncbi:MAG: FAD:protein FMN transferase [Deltaproteobacteria bacterium]|nr:FAD:protein FMN transferase [Deltaproteobacteria bacterium]
MPLHLYTFPFKALGSSCEVQLYHTGKLPDLARTIAAEVERKVSDVERRYSRYRDESIVSRINARAGGEAIEVDPETADLLDYAGSAFEQSGGVFDITSGVLRRVWNFKHPRVPQQDEIREMLKLVGWDKVEWHRPLIRLKLPGMELDFGGFGKEYCVDAAVSVLMKHGVSNALVNLGGDVRVLGGHPDGRPWSIGIAHPRRAGETAASLELKSGALATSGDYERYFEVDGHRYCHILNPKTGWPADGFQSVTVCSDLCLVAGTVSTTAMLLGEGAGLEFLRSSGVQFLSINKRGETVV